jgi:hypothetical protein
MAKRKGSFDETLDQAIADFTENGFYSNEQLESWMRRLREIALADAPSLDTLNKRMRKGLQAYYKRATSKSRVSKLNPGVSRFTIDQIAPELRSELDRRIRASANLIKLNRERSIDQTLQRFSGWATSVPEGGSRVVKKREVKDNVKKAFRQLSYEERRVAIDQGHKLMAAINDTIAEQNNAIAGMWRSHWRQPGYDYREDHKERDQKVYAVRGNWAIERGLMKKGSGYLDDMTGAGEEPFCRCYVVYLYNLRDLPDYMLTEKGRKLLAETRVSRSS